MSDSTNGSDDVVREVQWLAELGEMLYMLTITYWEGDSGNAVGHLYRRPIQSVDQPLHVLSTNDTLRTMWVSTSGSIWLASADGNVWTTADVNWPAPRSKKLKHEALEPSMSWTVTSLPQLRNTKLPPNVTAMWGTSDSDVHIGTHLGYMYHWDGADWKQVVDTPAGTINSIRGNGASDVFAVGFESTILHFDGSGWRRMQNPKDMGNNEVFGGVRHTDEGQVFICSHSGRLLHGSGAGLFVFGRYELPLFGMGAIRERLLFAAGPKGVAELKGSSVAILKANFGAVAVMEGMGRLYFIEPTQEKCGYVRYDPNRTEKPWSRVFC